MLHTIIDALRNSILITGLVIVMMMMIESLNIESKGLFFKGLKKTRVGQIIFGALLGSIPGCMGGFATVSLYTHRMFSFGALIAMMIASSGDEAFIMLAMIPEQALVIFAVLFVVAVVAGIIVDYCNDKLHKKHCHKDDHSECGSQSDCDHGYTVHCHEEHAESMSGCDRKTASDTKRHEVESEAETGIMHSESRHYGWKRIVMFIGLAVFIAALTTGQLGHDHGAHTHTDDCATVCTHHSVHSSHHSEHSSHLSEHGCTDVSPHHEHSAAKGHECHESHGSHHPEHASINLLDEQWMNVLFAGLSVLVLLVLLFASDHFIEEHLWNHIIRKHLLTIFCWTFGVLLLVGIGLQYIKLDEWISSNTALMIILATLIGIIPESGPHMIFVTLYATGIVPMPVLLASSISQDGHSSLPLIAESRKSFLWAKLINCAVALIVGFGAMLLFKI